MARATEEGFQEFELDLKRFVDGHLPSDQMLFIRKISLDLLKNLTMRSPVDTGRFRGAWVVGIDEPDTSVPNTPDKEGMFGNATVARGAGIIASLQEGQVLYISNNVDYAVSLELGHSKQAPHGMVAVSINEVMAWLNGQKNTSVEKL